MTTVLVTAVGGIAGYGVVRSLRRDLPGVRIVGCDTEPLAVGFRWCDAAEPAVAAVDARFSVRLWEIIDKYAVDVVVPTHPAELVPLADWADAPVPVVIERPELIRRTSDKWECFAWLTETDDPAAIPTLRIDEVYAADWEGAFEEISMQLGAPFIVKPRRGSGSQGVRIVENADELFFAVGRQPTNYMAQRLVGSASEEYTVGVFGDGSGGVAAYVVLRRELDRGGWTGYAELASPPGIAEAVHRVAGILRPRGPINLQFRRDGERWWLLEVNPRISSSTNIRSLLGYPEAAMAVRHTLSGELPAQPALHPGSVRRYVEEQLS